MSEGSVESILATRRSAFPLVVRAYESLLEQMPFLRKSLAGFVGAQDETFWTDGEERCREVVHLACGDLGAVGAAVSAWVDFSAEYLERQNRFLTTGRYACTSFDRIQHELYENSDRMQKYYLPALMCSFIFSSNYIGAYRFFRREMLPRIAEARTVCDVGCGHGVYLAQMLLGAGAARGTGLDISPSCLETAREVLTHHGVAADRFSLDQADLRTELPVDTASQDAVTCFEVIEHLDNPGHAVHELRRIVRPGGWLCLSTAIRMESIDHLHVFIDAEQVRNLLVDSGFTLLKDQSTPLTTQNMSDPVELKRLVDDPRVSVGYVALAS